MERNWVGVERTEIHRMLSLQWKLVRATCPACRRATTQAFQMRYETTVPGAVCNGREVSGSAASLPIDPPTDGGHAPMEMVTEWRPLVEVGEWREGDGS